MLDAEIKDLHVKGNNNCQQTNPVTTKDEETLCSKNKTAYGKQQH